MKLLTSIAILSIAFSTALLIFSKAREVWKRTSFNYREINPFK